MSQPDVKRWARLSPLLDEWLELDAQQRDTWLAQLLCDDEPLARDLCAYLAELSVVERERFLDGSALVACDDASPVGQTIGAYTLARPLGAGGMGSVWLARRSDGRFEGNVAVKLLNLALLGRGGPQRFAREGQVLARLAHPNIARLLDAGVVAGGQPYLVLEFVDGEPIDRWCDARVLAVEARVRLVRDVLAAVGHAHSNLVLHRDLKPSNILVTRDGQVKLLDFGIAKLLDDEGSSAGATDLTQLAGRAFTPDYAAPEQVQGSDVTTATDVYTLGVLLYVLLGGVHPTVKPTDTPVERLRSVVDTEPQRLSDAAARCEPAAAALRAQTPPKLARILRGDLDNIVAKALKKSPAERYATVDALAEDLRRWLGNEPVGAHADSLGYRVAKFVRRHRAAVLMSGSVAITLLASSAIALWQMVEANGQRRLAEEEAARAGSTLEFLQFVLSDAGASGRPFTTAELLARAERSIAAQHGSGASKLAVEQLITLGELHSGLGQHSKSMELIDTAYRIASTSRYTELRHRAACVLGQQLHFAAKLAEAGLLLEQTIAELSEQAPVARTLVDCLHYKADLELTKGDPAAGVAAATQAVALAKKTARATQTTLIEPLMQLAIAQRVAGERKLADSTYREVHQLLERLGRERTTDAVILYSNWGKLKADNGDIAGAARLIESALEIGRAQRPDGKPDYLISLNYAQRLLSLNRLDEAERLFSSARTTAHAEDDAHMGALALLGLVAVQRERGDLDAAETALGVVRDLVHERFPMPHPARDALLHETGWLHLARGSYAPASAAFSELVAHNAAAKARPQHALALALLAQAEHGLGEHERAASHAADASAMATALAVPGEPSYWVGHCLLVQAQLDQALGRDASARALSVKAMTQLGPTVGTDHPLTLKASELARE